VTFELTSPIIFLKSIENVKSVSISGSMFKYLKVDFVRKTYLFPKTSLVNSHPNPISHSIKESINIAMQPTVLLLVGSVEATLPIKTHQGANP